MIFFFFFYHEKLEIEPIDLCDMHKNLGSVFVLFIIDRGVTERFKLILTAISSNKSCAEMKVKIDKRRYT